MEGVSWQLPAFLSQDTPKEKGCWVLVGGVGGGCFAVEILVGFRLISKKSVYLQSRYWDILNGVYVF